MGMGMGMGCGHFVLGNGTGKTPKLSDLGAAC